MVVGQDDFGKAELEFQHFQDAGLGNKPQANQNLPQALPAAFLFLQCLLQLGRRDHPSFC